MNYLFPSVTKTLVLCCFLPVLAMLSCEKEHPEISGKNETFRISSAIINDEYEIFVYIPPVYNSREPKNRLIIGLDGDLNFNEIAGMISEKSENGTIPPCLYVGIGNAENRNRDYTPTAFKHGKGGAENFYRFLTAELLPELESRYLIDPADTKTLIGNSFGGLFTQYAMFRERASNPFNKFISTGCSYWFDSGIIFEYEQKYAETHNDLPVKFFNAMGTLEGGVSLASFEEMNERLKNRAYEGLEAEAALIEKHGHSGAANIGFKKGLDYVFSK